MHSVSKSFARVTDFLVLKEAVASFFSVFASFGSMLTAMVRLVFPELSLARFFGILGTRRLLGI